MNSTTGVKFESVLTLTDSAPPWHILRFPKQLVASFKFKGNLRRVICTLNGIETFNCALFPSRLDYFITLNRKLRERLGIVPGDNITVHLEKDESKYGMSMPGEFAEVLRQDAEGDRLFGQLSTGDQRLMLKLVVFVKNVDKRIARSLAGIELLKCSDGRFEYSSQHAAMRAASSANPGFRSES